MRLVWWTPKGSDPQDYVDEAVKYKAEIQVGRSEFIDPFLKGDYKTARLIEIPTITKRLGISNGGAPVGHTIMIAYDDEVSPEDAVEFRIEQQDLNTHQWKFKETVTADRVGKWTQARGVAYSELGYYRAAVMSGGKPISEVGKVEFFFYE